jgi:hypothetical protein
MNRFVNYMNSTFATNPEPVIPEESISQVIDFTIPNYLSYNAKIQDEPFGHLMPSVGDMKNYFYNEPPPAYEAPDTEPGVAILAASEDTLVGESSSAEALLESPMAAVGLLAVNAETSFQTGVDTNKDLSGNGVAGHSFGASYQAREDANHDSTVGLENMGLVGVGSFLGPEGTIAGLGLAALNSTFNSAPVATVQSDTGMQIPVSALGS